MWPIIISDNRPIVYRYMFLEVLMNNYKSLKDTFNKLGYKAKINTHTTSYIN